MNFAEKIVDHFLKSSEPKKFGNYCTDGKVLIYIEPKQLSREIVAVKYKDLTVGNSSRLQYAPRVSLEGSRTTRRNASETEIQRILAEKIHMIPFEVFRQAKLDLSKFRLISKGESETVIEFHDEKFYNTKEDKWQTKRKEISQHFTGASLFKLDSELFLFDLDRNELKHGILNPFLVKLADKKVQTIKEAYESLKPQTVKMAEKQGLDVKRQGEWFFIPSADFTGSLKKSERMLLQAGQNRPNYAESGLEIGGIFYVKGKISHSGREHKDLILDSWHVAIPNTATTSWTITGDID